MLDSEGCLFSVLSVWWEVVFTLGPHTTAYMRDIRADMIEKTLGESGMLPRYILHFTVNTFFLKML